ncbi:MAG: phosphatase PAP2 family protein [Negativicutes bacterium]|nr:phosphatase PAP2 family protein [Negativicutes bacterium]
MKTLAPAHSQNMFALTINTAFAVGLATALLVLSVGITDNPHISGAADFLGGLGNDLFLLLTNGLLIGWAWRRRLKSIITLTLWLDFLVWLTVQGCKLVATAPWTLRPNGGPGGFPSGHATHSFAMAILLTFFFPRLGWLWYLCAAAISWSRLETFWHNDLQIIAGIILGVTIGWAMLARWLKQPEAAAFLPQGETPLPTVTSDQAYAAD